MSLRERFLLSVENYPEKEAVVDSHRRLTYAELLRWSLSVSRALERAGERVGVLAPTSTEFVVAYFGALLSRRVPVPINFLLGAETVRYILMHSDIGTVVGAGGFLSRFCPEGVETIAVEGVHGEPARPALERSEVATILYTSGTTDKPKGVLLTHRNLISNAESCAEFISFTEDDVVLVTLPLFHSFGLMTGMILPLLFGARSVLMERFVREVMLSLIERERTTCLFSIPSLYRLLTKSTERSEVDTGSLRLCVSGGEALPLSTATAFEGLFGRPLLEGYGLTETSPVVSVNPSEAPRLGSVGKPLSWATIRLDEDGEVLIKGSSVTKGYFNDPRATAEAFTEDHFFRTGDIGRLDDDGYLWITGRKKEMIISAGENISPAEVEKVIASFDGVLEVGVTGVPDERKGEVPKAFVVLKDGVVAHESDIIRFCAKRLPPLKVPKYVEFREQLPHSPTGKVLRRLLK